MAVAEPVEVGIKDIALESPDYKKALDVMADLGVTDVIAEIMQENKQFRSSPLLCDGDGPIAEFRAWAAQFY